MDWNAIALNLLKGRLRNRIAASTLAAALLSFASMLPVVRPRVEWVLRTGSRIRIGPARGGMSGFVSQQRSIAPQGELWLGDEKVCGKNDDNCYIQLAVEHDGLLTYGATFACLLPVALLALALYVRRGSTAQAKRMEFRCAIDGFGGSHVLRRYFGLATSTEALRIPFEMPLRGEHQEIRSSPVAIVTPRGIRAAFEPPFDKASLSKGYVGAVVFPAGVDAPHTLEIQYELASAFFVTAEEARAAHPGRSASDQLIDFFELVAPMDLDELQVELIMPRDERGLKIPVDGEPWLSRRTSQADVEAAQKPAAKGEMVWSPEHWLFVAKGVRAEERFRISWRLADTADSLAAAGDEQPSTSH